MSRIKVKGLIFIAIVGLSIIFPLLPLQPTISAYQWAEWIPTNYDEKGYSNVTGGQVISTMEHLIVKPGSGASNDTVLYSELLINSNNDTILANYIDFEILTLTKLTGNIFNLKLPTQDRDELEALLSEYTSKTFTGSTVWDLIEFVFLNIWNQISPIAATSIESRLVDGKRAIFLEYSSMGSLGHVSFAEIGTKAVLIFNMANDSAWTNVSYFNTTVQSYVPQFLQPLKEILHISSINQNPILYSSIKPQQISPSGLGTILSSAQFESIAALLITAVPVPTYPFVFDVGQFVMIIIISIAIGLLVYYAINNKLKKKKHMKDQLNNLSVEGINRGSDLLEID